jgi:hypothetical protein
MPGSYLERGAQKQATSQTSHLCVLLDFMTLLLPNPPSLGFQGLAVVLRVKRFYSFADLQFFSDSLPLSRFSDYFLSLYTARGGGLWS